MNRETGDMDIRINGNHGPSIRFRIGVIALVQVVVALVTFAAAMKVAQADIDRLQRSQHRFEEKVDRMLDSQRRAEVLIETLSEEIRYYREKLDKHVENHSRTK